MARIFNDYAYGQGPRTGCWWDETADIPSMSEVNGTPSVDVAVIGGGFTGVCAALRLAFHGVSVAVIEAQDLGWGASGRNGGFCCLGGGLLDDAVLDRTYGKDERLSFRRSEKAAVTYVEQLISDHGIDVDRHSDGETALAHRLWDMSELEARAAAISENYGVTATLLQAHDLADQGMQGGPFHGALTVPIGFGLNPRKYLAGLVRAAVAAGARLFTQSPVSLISQVGSCYRLTCPNGVITADQVIVATNGYSSETVPDGIAARYMPSQSNVLVTRPLTSAELAQQGWTTDQMCYDTRNLLHYFRLMPDRRFLFGMRGGLLTGAYFEAKARDSVRRHFQRMFPKWAEVETTHAWSGMVSLARNRLPFVGQISGAAGQWAAMCYHGNGVAMGSYAGRLVADMVMGQDDGLCPQVMRVPLARFPFGRARRVVMPPMYAGLKYADRTLKRRK